jgi:CDP-diacylglycerol--serine O-phosphatidyltransferase
MYIIRNLPNLLTLFNLFLGCLAILFYFNTPFLVSGTTDITNTYTVRNINLGNIDFACYCIFIAAVIDFFDGFVARWLKIESELGRQLDSLADMVTFGLVPGLIMTQLIAFSFYTSEHAFE